MSNSSFHGPRVTRTKRPKLLQDEDQVYTYPALTSAIIRKVCGIEKYVHHIQHVLGVTEIVPRVIEWSSNSDTVCHCRDGRCFTQDSNDLFVHCLVVASIQISSL